ncbi:hypothetical protein [Yinghuangia sp. YIM S09857]|uniref:hypothetical protein n=1 Tax=Yinghuangia sp. YIM S09857 TaxID=3436929 RepID=UPI003F52F20A
MRTTTVDLGPGTGTEAARPHCGGRGALAYGGLAYGGWVRGGSRGGGAQGEV